MSEIRFYHLKTQRMEQALPGLLLKALDSGKRIIVKGTDEARLKQLNETLWSYDANSFLPHGMKGDGFSADQPVYLTISDENPNGAEIVIHIDGSALYDDDEQFSMQCQLFDDFNEGHKQMARQSWKDLQGSDKTLTYWQQTQSGWEKKG